MNKDPYRVTEQAPLIILYRKSGVYMANNGKDAKHTRHFSRIIHSVRNGEYFNLHKTLLFKGCLLLADIVIRNVSEDELNPRLGYSMVRL